MLAKDVKTIVRMMANFQLQEPRLNIFKSVNATYDNNFMQMRY